MLDFFTANIFVTFGGHVFQQTVGILKGTNCATLFGALFHYYEAGFIRERFRKKDKKLAISFNLMFRCIDDVLSLNNTKFGDCVKRIYPIELLKEDTTDTIKSASYLD